MTEARPDRQKIFNYLGAGAFVSGVICLVAGAGREYPMRELSGALTFMVAATALYLLRFAREAWRPRRFDPFTMHLAYVTLMVVPSSLVSVKPALSFTLSGGFLAAYFAFHSFKETFSADTRGFLSPGAFGAAVAVGASAVALIRYILPLLGPGAVSPWFSLSRDPAVPARDLGHMYEFLLVAAFPVLAALTGTRIGRGRRLAFGLAAALTALGIALSFCRAAWVAFMVELALLAVMDRRRRLAILLGCVGLLVLMALVPGVLGRAGSIFAATESTNSQRLEQWSAALALVGRSPFLGHGLGTFQELYGRMGGTYSAVSTPFPHNLFLHLAAECGLPALFILLTWMFWFFSSWPVDPGQGEADDGGWRRGIRLAARAAQAGFLTFGFFDL